MLEYKGDVMEAVILSVKNLFIAYFLSMILLQFVANDSYRKMIRMFLSLGILVMFLSPVLKASGKGEQVLSDYLSQSFLLGIRELQQDLSGMPGEEKAQYVLSYERGLEKQITQACRDQGYRNMKCQVDLTDDLQIESIRISGENQSSLEQCQKWMCEMYGLKEEQVVIW